MVEIMHRGFAIKTECRVCGAELKFQWGDMKYMTNKDREYEWDPIRANKTKYIECPVCHEKIFVRDDNLGWINGTVRIYEDTNKEVQDGRINE